MKHSSLWRTFFVSFEYQTSPLFRSPLYRFKPSKYLYTFCRQSTFITCVHHNIPENTFKKIVITLHSILFAMAIIACCLSCVFLTRKLIWRSFIKCKKMLVLVLYLSIRIDSKSIVWDSSCNGLYEQNKDLPFTQINTFYH